MIKQQARKTLQVEIDRFPSLILSGLLNHGRDLSTRQRFICSHKEAIPYLD